MTKKTAKKPDEFEAMKEIHEILRQFGKEARHRMWVGVEEKIVAEAPKKRVRKPKALPPDPRQAVIPGAELPN